MPYADELKGIARDSKIPLGEIFLYNIFFEMFTLCTSIVGQDKSGHVLHARNLDFGVLMGWDVKNNTWLMPEYLRQVVINVDFIKGGVLQYKAASFVGYVGLITGMRPVRI